MSLRQRIMKKLNPVKCWFRLGSKDHVEIILGELRMLLDRNLFLDTPHEVHVIVPRAVLRKYKAVGDKSVLISETILDSITIVHAPRHPLAAPPPQPGAIVKESLPGEQLPPPREDRQV